MAEYIQRGSMIDYKNTSEAKIATGSVIAVGCLIGIADGDIEIGAVGAVSLDGVFEFAKASGEIAQGAPVFWDAANSKITSTASGNTPAGVAVAAAASGDTIVRVKINASAGGTGAVATTTVAGSMLQGAAVADAASTAPTAAEFKALLDSLRAAGIIAMAADD